MRVLITFLVVLFVANTFTEETTRERPVFRIEHSWGKLLRKQLTQRGWINGKKEKIPNPDFLWVLSHNPSRILDPKLLYNKISNGREVSDKTYLTKNLKSFCDREHLDLYSFYPRSYMINKASDDLERFIADFNRGDFRKNAGKTADKNSLYQPLPAQTIDGLTNTWILKPEWESGGWGIELMSTMEEFYDYKKRSKGKGFVVQKYIEDPLLIHGKKFDIRQHAIIARKKPLVLFNRDVAAFKLTQNQYNLTDTKDLYLHVTNFAKQKKAPGYNSEDGFWGLDNFRKYLRDDLKQPKVWDEKIQHTPQVLRSKTSGFRMSLSRFTRSY
eukprot:TRINITY_DN979_c0_g1_i1.p1 TRINITY_DN979_c0_g1~~TRINITY_DN979_c0_g1_i1.p1  ORF type:complete len:328 (-),score=57.67 TRINITY_DN979_c0_g1_i1:71-1054(-)